MSRAGSRLSRLKASWGAYLEHIEQRLRDGGHAEGVVAEVGDAPVVGRKGEVPHLAEQHHKHPLDLRPLQNPT